MSNSHRCLGCGYSVAGREGGIFCIRDHSLAEMFEASFEEMIAPDEMCEDYEKFEDMGASERNVLNVIVGPLCDYFAENV